MKKLIAIVCISIAVISCQKEYSFEGDAANFGISNGTLPDSSGTCFKIKFAGKYEMDTAFTNSTYITATINFTSTGKYVVFSDTINGCWFIDSGYTIMTGQQTVKVKGYGKPILPLDPEYTLYYKNSSCKFKCKASAPWIITGTNGDYFPTTSYSNWTYLNSQINDTVLITVAPDSVLVNANYFRKFILYVPILNSYDTLYYRKDGLGTYYRYYPIGNSAKTEFIFLKDNVPVNSTWQSPTVTLTIGGLPTQAKFKFTILQKDVTATIGTNTIDSIIKVKEELQYFIAGSFQTVNTNEQSYAKKIGQVEFMQVNVVTPVTVRVRRWKVY